MLQAIRDKAQGWIAWVIVGFISIPFALWGIQEYIGVGGDQVAAKVDGSEITQQQLESNVERFRNQLRQVFGSKIPEAYSDEALRKQVLDGMINDYLVTLHVEKEGIRAGDGMIRAAIRNHPSFQSNGNFDPELYKTTLLQRGQSPESYENSIRQELSVDVLRNAISDTSIVSDAELNSYLSLKQQQRLISYLIVTNTEEGVELVTDAEVQAWYDENSNSYIRPEQVRLDYLVLSPEIIAADISIDAATIQTYYDEHMSNWTADEKRSARHILFTVNSSITDAEAKAAAEAVLTQIRDGGDFAQLAREHSADPGSAAAGGDLGVIDRGIMVKPFEDAAFALEEGQVSELVRSRFGYHIIEVTEIQGGEIKPLAEVEGEIVNLIKQDEAEGLFFDRAEQLANLVYDSPDSLVPAAETLGLEIQQSDWLAQGENPQNSIGTSRVMAAVYSDDVMKQGYNSEVIELDDGRLIVVRLQELRESAVRSFDEVAEAIRQQLEYKKKSEIAETKAAALVERLEAGESLQEIATAEGLELDADKTINRETNDVPGAIVLNAFTLQQSGDKPVYTTAALVTGNHAVIELKSITDGDVTAMSETQRNELRKQLADTRGDQVLSAYIAWLRSTNEIEIISQ